MKQRFKTINTNLLRLNTYSTNEISLNIQDKIFKMFEKNVAKYDVVIFSDFNYGCLPQRLVEKIIKVSKNNITITADSQSSSQLGNISRYHNTKLITPTEREARLISLNNNDGLVIIAEELRKKQKLKILF